MKLGVLQERCSTASELEELEEGQKEDNNPQQTRQLQQLPKRRNSSYKYISGIRPTPNVQYHTGEKDKKVAGFDVAYITNPNAMPYIIRRCAVAAMGTNVLLG